MGSFIELTGRRFGKWTVERRDGSREHPVRWQVVCDCGNRKSVDSAVLRDGRSMSCGCDSRERSIAGRTKHGHSKRGHKSPTYRTWASMISRCTNPRLRIWKYYGGRGVEVCDRWRNSFLAFLEDMGERPSGMSIDRIDPNGGYCPGNCRWATDREQARNRRDTVMVNIAGSAVPAVDAAQDAGLSPWTVRKRLRDGLAPDAALDPRRRTARIGMRGDANPGAKLSRESVEGIRAAHASGESQAALARRFCVSKSTVNLIVLGKTWR